MLKRKNDRKNYEFREISLTRDISPYAEGSCLVKFGNTHVICTASIDEKVPFWLRGTGKGWITAEYGMLPRSTHKRMDREISKGKISGRTQEIQRLIGRSLRAVVDLKILGELQIKIDCDVLQADGGTRTASITGAWVALHDSVKFLISKGIITKNPILYQVAAISCGIVDGEVLLDLDYDEDSNAEVDANFVLSENNGIIEIQTTSEKKPIDIAQFNKIFELVLNEIKYLFQIQSNVLMINENNKK